MYWFKHGRDVCIGSNMGEMYVLVQTWERCMYWFKIVLAVMSYRFLECVSFDPIVKASLWSMVVRKA